MNTLTIIILITILGFMIVGYNRGLFKSVMRLVMTAVAVIVSYFVAPIVGGYIIQNTNIDEYFEQKVYISIETTVRNQIADKLKLDDTKKNKEAIDSATELAMKVEPTKKQQVELIKNLNMPAFVKNALLDNNHSEFKKNFKIKSFYKYISTYVACMIVNAIAFIATFVMAMVILGIISIVLSIVVSLPIVNGINKMGGMLFGGAEAILIVWLFFVVIAIFANTQFGTGIYRQVEDSDILTAIYNKNIIMNIITDLSNT